MRPSPLDWISRVVMLVLAGMVSLSIIGAIAAIPSGSIEQRIGLRQAEQPVPEPQERAPAPEPAMQPGEAADRPGQGPGTAAAAPPPMEEPGIERWLETIAYALLALAGLTALAVLILWWGLHERRRVAEALEALAHRPDP